MTFKYKYIDLVSADVTFQAEADTLEELFIASGKATFEVMVDLKTIGAKEKVPFDIDNDDLGMLLLDFISELVFLKDTEGMTFKDFEIKIEKDKQDFYKLHAAALGEKIDYKKREYKTDVKAVTYHQFYVKQDPESKKWQAQVILDI